MSAQCISIRSLCDGQRDCHSGTDEENCAAVNNNAYFKQFTSPPPPAIVHLNPKNWVNQSRSFESISDVTTDSGESVCPESHFQCPGDGYCLPVYLRCNAVSDCPGREDEAACGSCPGFYRCYASNVCVHPSNVHPSLDLSAVKMPRLDTNSFSLFPNLHILNLSLCGVELMYGEGLQAASALQVLDLAGCPMTQFPRNQLSGLDRLQSVRAGNFKLCCPANLPAGFNPANCKAPFDEVSSCEALLRSDVYRFFLSTFSALALLGNLGCFLLRSVCFKSGKSGFGVFVTHLSFSDFLMGVYLAIIGVSSRALTCGRT